MVELLDCQDKPLDLPPWMVRGSCTRLIEADDVICVGLNVWGLMWRNNNPLATCMLKFVLPPKGLKTNCAQQLGYIETITKRKMLNHRQVNSARTQGHGSGHWLYERIFADEPRHSIVVLQLYCIL
jgi:hypothetical protein